LTTTDATTFLSGSFAAFLGWLVYVIRFTIMKQTIVEIK